VDDDIEAGEALVRSRTQEFGGGMLGGTSMYSPSPGLMADAQRFNAQVPKRYVPNGSSSGVSAGQYQATMGGAFRTQNGASDSTYATKKYFGGNGI